MELKRTVTQIVNEVYKKEGLATALTLCNKLLVETEHGADRRDEKGIIKGELAEASLSCILQAIQDKLKMESAILKGIYVEDTDTNKVTELDVTFVTPYAVYLFECKSYSGQQKELKGKCELYRKGEKIADVYEQNALHLILFNRRYGGYVKKGSRPYRLILYDYATNKFVDKRTEENKRLMPVLNQSNLVEWIQADLQEAMKRGKIVKSGAMITQIERDCRRKDTILGKEHRRQLNY